MLIGKLFRKGEVRDGKIPELDVSEIVIDSRRANENSLFVCLVGSFSDGHRFVMGAYMNGCRCFLVERDVVMPEDAVILKVDNTREMLAKISCRFYNNPSHELKVIGITGTKGKTTTALMVANLLNASGKNCGYIGSNGVEYNKSKYKTENTTPESIVLQKTLRDMVNSGVGYVVLEVSSQALYTYRVDGVRFDSVAFTNLARDHIGGIEHPTMEHYIDCKTSLFSLERGAKFCCFNADDSMAERITGKFNGRRISYSVKGNGEVNAGNFKYYQTPSEIGTMFTITDENQTYEAALPMPGDFNVINATCAFTICREYVDNAFEIVENISKINAEGRFEIYHTKKGVTFVIDYAHNGLSLACALEELRKFCKGELICLFGSVGDRTFGRREELGSAAATYADYCIITSDNPGYEDPMKVINEIAVHVRNHGCPYETHADRKEAILMAYNRAKKNDIVLLAGKGHESYQLVKGIKEPFSEKMILEEIIKKESKTKK